MRRMMLSCVAACVWTAVHLAGAAGAAEPVNVEAEDGQLTGCRRVKMEAELKPESGSGYVVFDPAQGGAQTLSFVVKSPSEATRTLKFTFHTYGNVKATVQTGAGPVRQFRFGKVDRRQWRHAYADLRFEKGPNTVRVSVDAGQPDMHRLSLDSILVYPGIYDSKAARKRKVPDCIPAELADDKARLTQIKESDNALYRQGFLDVTLYNGWRGHAVDPKGVKDSTAALQKAIVDAVDARLAVFFPTGTYRVSDTLQCMKKSPRYHPEKGVWLQNGSQIPVLIGSTKARRPLIKLKDGCARFQDANRPKAVVHMWTQHSERGNSEQAVTRIDDLNEVDWGASCGFKMEFRGIDIDVGCNNPGAAGLAFYAAQGASLTDCRVNARDGVAGIWGLPSRGMGGANLEVIGGDYGIYAQRGAGSIAVGCRLIGQKKTAVQLNNFVPCVLVGFEIRKKRAPALVVGEGWSVGGALMLYDGTIEIEEPGGTLIDNKVGEIVYLRNVYATGAGKLIENKQAAQYTLAPGWTRVREYAYGGHSETTPALQWTDGRQHHDEIVALEPGPAAPPRDFVARHLWERLPSFEEADAKNVRDSDIGAKGDGKTDDTAALRKALAEYPKVFLPKGEYVISGTLTLGRKTKLFGTAEANTTLLASKSWQPAQETPLLETVDDHDAATYLGDLSFQPRNAANFANVHWRAGRHSLVNAIGGGKIRISGHGGGRWYFWYTIAKCEEPLVTITGTQEPLTFYGFNPEHCRHTPEVVVRDCRNVRTFATKVESGPDVMHIENSRNIMVLGHGGHHARKEPQSAYVVRHSSDVVLAGMGAGKRTENVTVVTEQLNGHSTALPGGEFLALYKRGEVDDSAWGRGGNEE
ncbi:MAG: hypothetical protein JXR37_22450 [Kiritimatiellae bacterium]|nr:hypothetical protein [Kiritimatiellia bacterium]